MKEENSKKGNNINIVALIVSFNPDQRLISAVKSLDGKLDNIVIIENNSTKKDVIKQLQNGLNNPNVVILELDSNRGIAGALNYGIEYIERNFSADYILTLDQDTIIMVHDLKNLIFEANKRWNNVGIIAMGSKETHRGHGYRERKYAITSGNIVSVEIFRKTRFREEFFMDQVDFDFDYNVRRLGYRIILAEGRLMDHRLGVKIGKLSYEPPTRIYYMVRNSTVLFVEGKLPLYMYINQILSWSLSSMLKVGPFKLFRILLKALFDALNRNLDQKKLEI